MTQVNRQPSVFGEKCVIRGDVSIDCDALVLGQIDGIVRVGGALDIAPDAQVNGTAVAGAVRIAGPCRLNVVAERGIELLAGSSLTGCLYTTRLSVVEGARFDGELHVGADAPRAAQGMLDQIDSQGELPAPEPANRLSAEVEAPAPHRFPVEAISHSPTSIVSNLLSQRRARLLAAAGNFTQAVDLSTQQAAG